MWYIEKGTKYNDLNDSSGNFPTFRFTYLSLLYRGDCSGSSGSKNRLTELIKSRWSCSVKTGSCCLKTISDHPDIYLNSILFYDKCNFTQKTLFDPAQIRNVSKIVLKSNFFKAGYSSFRKRYITR